MWPFYDYGTVATENRLSKCGGRPLVNMTHHDYREGPNVRFSPDKTMVFLASNLFGASYVFGGGGEEGRKHCGSRCEGHGGAGAAVEAAGSGAWEVG